MSHMTKAATSITNPNEQLLREAVEAVAKEEGGTIISEVTSMERKTAKVTIGIKSPSIARGIGFNIEDGKLNVVGDSWGVQAAWQNTRDKVIQEYTARAAVRSTMSLGYRPTMRQKQGDKIVITVTAP